MTLSFLQSLGVSVSINGEKLRLDNLDILPPAKRLEIVELAKANKETIIRELSGGFDLDHLAGLLRAAGIALWLESPYNQRPPLLVVKAPDGNRVDFPSWLPTSAPGEAVKDYVTRHHNRVADGILEWMKTKAYPPGMCELCGAVGTWVEQYGKGFRCSSHTWHFGKSGKSLPIETARKSCPLSTRSVH